MPFVSGFLRVRKRRPGGGPVDPGWGIEEGEGPVDPGWGIEEGAGIGGGPIIPEPPPGIWPGPTPGHPIQPVPPGEPGEPGSPSHPIALPPGSIWPPPPPGVSGNVIILAYVPEYGWKYFIVDTSLRPDNELPEEQPHPQPLRR